MQKKILVLDDDLIITEILGQLVKNLGHYPVIATMRRFLRLPK